MNLGAVILAGGSGRRMDCNIKKQYLKINGESIFIISLKKLLNIKSIDQYVLVIPEEDKKFVSRILKENNIKNVKIAYGGNRRQDSVVNGLKMLKSVESVLIHDSVRPFFKEQLINKGIKQLRNYSAVIPAIPLKDTIKKVENGVVSKTLDRSKLVAVQTPQFFDYKELLNLYEKFNNINFTDDSYLFELKNKEVSIIMGLEENIKITTPVDYEIAKMLVKKGKVNV
ncbi:MAG: 2-C-methyl-D-erythritol 4-phosphate cytidylyltransferase [Candidatus Mcinerneyibacterium aminivorans]|uniref:2-C-methyl-D-erythritol 4-phosphate cytidylyltransferase n=1 Tax=Candidatus Mcinerneyibacterium aminivorans TaxID=2703815 RepID=A0A5D0MH98_9BACT|nr:MAG: 2-C-methyl-D-erythritol 4-phosphate cytidylyltransferase [Candidatus Mcinerneyibacterium aminivorans]